MSDDYKNGDGGDGEFSESLCVVAGWLADSRQQREKNVGIIDPIKTSSKDHRKPQRTYPGVFHQDPCQNPSRSGF
ncbi:predicted protein [Sclerotinia sclerotiorum 1980 UF-70]|uniref:Uncharacterized protein n=1 Tax=Sclerotinia sclerotiorum (strain ATCC 18683 / 1980 / Ss-1) TaxID=665079 RepID=A7ERY2_SCLS1|nr:predicted protein [Sclerotinia sclerotiorum 1980 UF-70]EDN92224.1 predicted protein [Sclerotinia sclerotiorum 1980 UF-70]